MGGNRLTYNRKPFLIRSWTEVSTGANGNGRFRMETEYRKDGWNMPMRLSGLMSGMDTESIIQQLVEAKKTKVTKAVKAQKTLKYKQDAWKDLNKQIVNLYNKSLTSLRYQSSYIKKTTKVSNSSVVSVITGENAMNSVQSLKVEKLAKSGYLAGGKLELKDENGNVIEDGTVTGSTKLSELGLGAGSGSIQVRIGNEVASLQIDENSTVDAFVSALRTAGVNANFDATNQRLYVSAKASGEKNDFELLGMDGQGVKALKALQLSYSSSTVTNKYDEIINNQASTTEARQKSRLENLTSVWKTGRENRQGILEKMDPEYIKKVNQALQDAGKSIQLDENTDYDNLTEADWEAINDAVETVFDKASADTISGADPDALEAAKAALGTWMGNQMNIESAEGQLEKNADGTLKTDSEGKFILTQQTKDDIAAEVQKEVDDAKAAKAELAAGGNSGQKTAGEDALIYLNGVEYKSDKNTLEINGLTLTLSATTAPGEEVTITTEDDTNGIYDMIKNFFKEYNTLINQMDKLYNADSSKGYEPLTDEEKDAMSDSAIEEWENKIKDSILRKDSVLSTVSGAMKQIMLEGVEVNGKQMYLSNFGINTLNYFISADNEKNAYHIDGDPDDENTSGNADKLKSMIANDPDTVVSFFTQLSQKLSDKMFDLMKSKEGYSSAMTVYDDKKMQTDYDDYTAKIKELEKKLADYEDKWYAKFAAMETALAKMQNNASAVTSLLGG